MLIQRTLDVSNTRNRDETKKKENPMRMLAI